MIAVIPIPFQPTHPVLDVKGLLAFSHGNFFLHCSTTIGLRHFENQETLALLNQAPLCIRRIAVRRTSCLTTKGQTEKITTQLRQQGRQGGIDLIGLPRRQCIGRHRIVTKIKVDRCQMATLGGDRKVHLRCAHKKTFAAVNDFHALMKIIFLGKAKPKSRSL